MIFAVFRFLKKTSLGVQMSVDLDANQAQHFVMPDLGPNCLQRLSTDNKSGHKPGKS